MSRPITIIGGGLAGLTLGIALRRHNVVVCIQEALGYPRHRVCGEFICGRGLDSLQRLGLTHLLYEAGARPAQDFALFIGTKMLPSRHIPSYKKSTSTSSPQALSISRWALDATLAAEFERLGGIIRHERHPPLGELTHSPRLSRHTHTPEGIVDATGRKLPSRTPSKRAAWRWVGIKAHARALTPFADLELHITPHGYVGLCQLSQGEVNVCGLFRHRASLPDLAKTWQQKLATPPALQERLAEAEWVEGSFCAVAGLDFRAAATPCRIGDARGMLPPFTGNGMSAAFESAELAAGPLAAYAHGLHSWAEANRSIMRLSRARFGRRHLLSRLIHPILFSSASFTPLVHLLSRFPPVTSSIFQLTR